MNTPLNGTPHARTTKKPAPRFRINTWRKEGQPDAICIRKGGFFLVVEVAEAYDLVNAVHDLAEDIERSTA
ncbi:hypothetical protein [Leucobacter aridicollis]|uniref:hypothetical protein n=1 Tax=Leucobacter aridicollis TaxID=283878 RepID=UPI002104BFB7|nr:hypothetical protein [Leucobacter aridicollis]UTX53386.1 hypothetical protein KI794_01065 [Leucobacter aridicollis]